MPRTIDHIVATHQHAQALRAAGKSIWAARVDIRSVIRANQEKQSAEHIARISNEIAVRLKRGIPARYFDVADPDFDFDFNDAVDILATNTAAGLEKDEEEGMSFLVDFNGQLDIIYDWADRNRVWLG